MTCKICGTNNDTVEPVVTFEEGPDGSYQVTEHMCFDCWARIHQAWQQELLRISLIEHPQYS